MLPTLVTSGMSYWRIAPDARLRPHVSCYFLALPSPSAEQSVAQAHEEELLLPDGHSEVVFGLSGAFERWQLGQPARRCTMRHSYVIGSRSHSVLTRDLGPVAVAGIKLDPRALPALLGMPLAVLRDETIGLAELGVPELLALEDAVASAGSAAGVGAVLDAFLLRALRDVPPADVNVVRLLQQIRQSRGSLSIMGWARQRHVDARHLERRFAESMGMTPKRYARIVRFKHGYHALLAATAEPAGSRQRLAAAHLYLDGFYDQSHFNKEFRAFMGTSPSARLKATLAQATSISDHLLAGELESAS